jgi:hypothetical protein
MKSRNFRDDLTILHNIRGITGSGVWVCPLCTVVLWTLGGKLPFWEGWLTGEIFGKLVGGSATGAVQNDVKCMFSVDINKKLGPKGKNL